MYISNNNRNNKQISNILIYCSFIIASLIVIAAFITSTTYTQLIVAILLYPPLVYFALKAFPRKDQGCPFEKPVTATEPLINPVEKAEKIEVVKREHLGIADIDKRVFLKLLGGVGLSLFLFSIFNKKSEGLFFKSLPAQGVTGKVSLEDIAGNKIDPAQNQPTDGYRISEVDDNIITFYGFTNKDGAWFIMKEDTETGSFRYARGISNFPSSWTNRENLKYDYFNNAF